MQMQNDNIEEHKKNEVIKCKQTSPLNMYG